MDLIKSLTQIHLACKHNIPLNCVKYLNIFLKGHGVGKEALMYESGSSPNKLLKALNDCQLNTDIAELNDSLYSFCLDENTTHHKCASALMLRSTDF